ncbi:MAG: hypothetical protein COT89_02490 [Candidatus Colwellbacteria bacterium CG10_big_fil_rev_8_21_14_0_10_42_22]|uniref:CDP-diacylglycerol--glycerol-3-phosphate 3-phosphatidyltransferase n=1 Tax=Candidatus Colwellbacteria bacterium CG10_big_fil_rev_8_21_14_0_10_42_22 TaxID=1974540 RepID=A0A2H0VFN6_9BACT|nr:MAG: hypothetical protein COT89_02490 [Candidatus Colwellbacteria bacterium CG10_big_fil_rev_8_21_14_0_10_42_22]
MLKKLPNWLGYARMVLTPVVMGFIYYGDNEFWTGFVFAIVVATDGLDGPIARATHSTSQFGIMLDTLADKFLIAGCVLALVAKDPVWLWAGFIIIDRDFLVMTLKANVGGGFIKASNLGKIKMGLQSVAIYLVINPWPFNGATGWNSPGGAVMALALWFTLFSAWDYYHKYTRFLRWN